MYPEKSRSNWWYIVPILFSLIGGIISYYAIRRDDPKKAKNCLYLGLILTGIGIVVNVLLVEFEPIPDAWYGVNI